MAHLAVPRHEELRPREVEDELELLLAGVTGGVVQGQNGLVKEIERIALENLQRGVREKKPLNDIRDDIFYPVRRYLRKQTGRNPLIVPTVIES